MLDQIVGEAADAYGPRPALVTNAGRSLSYTDLHRLSDEVAAGLLARGVEPGDVVALCLPSGPEYVVAYAAAAKVGAVTAGVNARLTMAERQACLQVAQPRFTIASPALLPAETGRVMEIDTATDVESILHPLRARGARPPVLAPAAGRNVAIVFTSGTTGRPKGALFTTTQLAAVERMDTNSAGWGGGISVAATQFAHIGTMTKLAWQLRGGTTTYVLDHWRPGDALRLMAELKVTAVAGVPPQIAMMLRHASFDDYDWSAVRAIVAGGGPASPALVDEAQRRFGAPFSIRYSSTESGGVGCGTAFDASDDERRLTVGRPRGEVELSLRDESGHEVAPGEVGEVCLRSDAATVGYWRDEDATAALRWPDGFLRMGDLGRLVTSGPATGCLQLVGRAREMYVRGGYNVYPMEVEAVLSAHPDVSEVAVVARPDDVMGEIGVAVVVPAGTEPAPTLDELRSFAATRLAAYKLPEVLTVTSELPRTAMDKLDRRALGEAFG